MPPKKIATADQVPTQKAELAPEAENLARQTVSIRITEQLRTQADAAWKAIYSLDPDDLAAADIQSVRIKYDDYAIAKRVGSKVEEILNTLKPTYWRLEKERVVVEQDGRFGYVVMHWDLAVPPYFNDLMADLVKSQMDLLEIEASIATLANLYDGALQVGKAIWLGIDPKGVSGQTEACKVCEANLLQTTQPLSAFLNILVSSRITEPHHLITIEGSDYSELIVKDREMTLEFGKERAALRALISIALLRGQQWFTLEQFDELYYRDGSKDLGKTFNNAMEYLRGFLPQLGYDKNNAQRRIKGLYFKQVPPQENLNRLLAAITP